MNKTLEATLTLVNEAFESDQASEAIDFVCVALTAKFEMVDILEALEDATSVYDVYEATGSYMKETKRKLEVEEIRCDSTAKLIQEDVALEMAIERGKAS